MEIICEILIGIYRSDRIIYQLIPDGFYYKIHYDLIIDQSR